MTWCVWSVCGFIVPGHMWPVIGRVYVVVCLWFGDHEVCSTCVCGCMYSGAGCVL